jgi:hypothetical protein
MLLLKELERRIFTITKRIDLARASLGVGFMRDHYRRLHP